MHRCNETRYVPTVKRDNAVIMGENLTCCWTILVMKKFQMTTTLHMTMTLIMVVKMKTKARDIDDDHVEQVQAMLQGPSMASNMDNGDTQCKAFLKD